MSRLKTLLWKEFKSNARLWFAVVVGLTVLGMMSVLVMVLLPNITPEEYRALLPEPSPMLALTDCVGNLWQIGGLVACVIAAASIPAEVERGTMELVLSSPVRPWEIIASKYISRAVMIAIAVYTSALATWAYSHVLGGYPIARIIIAATYLILALMVVTAISALVGALFRTQVAAIACSIALNLTVALLKTLARHHTILQQAHPFTCVDAAYNVISLANITSTEMLTSIVISAAYIALFSLLSTLAFKWRFEMAPSHHLPQV